MPSNYEYIFKLFLHIYSINIKQKNNSFDNVLNINNQLNKKYFK